MGEKQVTRREEGDNDDNFRIDVFKIEPTTLSVS